MDEKRLHLDPYEDLKVAINGSSLPPLIFKEVRLQELLCSGLRGKGNIVQDLREARDAVERAIQMEESKIKEDART